MKQRIEKVEKINKSKSQIFGKKKTNNIDKPLATLFKGKKNKNIKIGNETMSLPTLQMLQKLKGL